MQLNNTQRSRPLTRDEVKREMKRRKGFTFASYSRFIKRHKSAVTRLADGEIGGDLRERFLVFFGFTEKEIPYRGTPGTDKWRRNFQRKKDE